MIGSNTKVIALIGNPVKHSLSPKIHNYLIKKYSKEAVYVAFEFSTEDLTEVFKSIKKMGFAGLNVTMPFKEEVFKLVDKTDGPSSIIKSVNTVKFYPGKRTSRGFNTDVKGFIKSVDDRNFKWLGKQCLVLGAGGSAKSTIYGMLKKGVREIYVYSRTKEKIYKIIDNFRSIGSDRIKALQAIGDMDNKIKDTDLIVNCTPVGMDIGIYKNKIIIPGSWNLKGKVIFDMVYKPVETRLVKKARKEGAIVINGLDMLLNQALFSFKIWFNLVPRINMVKKILLDNVQ